MDSKNKETTEGLRFEPYFCPVDLTDPFESVAWEKRRAQIKGENGELLFEQSDCEIPADWSQLATNIVVSKYFYGEVGTPEREHSVRQLIHRVSRTITDWGLADGYLPRQRTVKIFIGTSLGSVLINTEHSIPPCGLMLVSIINMA